MDNEIAELYAEYQTVGRKDAGLLVIAHVLAKLLDELRAMRDDEARIEKTWDTPEYRGEIRLADAATVRRQLRQHWHTPDFSKFGGCREPLAPV